MSEIEANSSPFNVICQNRETIFLAEIGALIHDLGKLSEEFLFEVLEQRPFKHHLILRRNVDKIPSYYTADQQEDAAKLYVSELTKETGQCLAAQRLMDFLHKISSPKHGGLVNTIRNFRDQNPDTTEVCNLTLDFLNKFPTRRRERLRNLMEIESDVPEGFVPELLTASLEAHVISLPRRSLRCSLADFIEMHHNPAGDLLEPPNLDKDLMRVFCRCCDGVVSGIDKSSPGKKQSMDRFYVASAFGYEKTQTDSDKGSWLDPCQLGNFRRGFCNKLLYQLGQINDADIGKVAQARQSVLESAKDNFVHALGETRRAANDITLWDHSYSVASMFKALVAKILIENQEPSRGDIYEFPDRANVQWRILRITFDSLGTIAKGHKIGDVLGYLDMFDTVKAAAKHCVEVSFPVGNEIYRDENGIYFVIPHLKTEELNKSFEYYLRDCLSELIVQKTDEEFVINIGFSAETKTFFSNLGSQIEQARREFLYPFANLSPSWRRMWDKLPEHDSRSTSEFRSYLRRYIICDDICEVDHESKRKEYGTLYPHPLCERAANCIGARQDENIERTFLPQIEECPVCHLHPKCEQQELCCSCYKRRNRRVDSWLDDPQGTTIWMNEVADDHNRSALIAGKFGLAEWLNGNFVPTMLTLSLEDWLLEKRKKIKDEVFDNLDWEPSSSEEYPYDLAKDLLRKFANEYKEGNDEKFNSILQIYNSFIWPGTSRQEIDNDLFERGMTDSHGKIRDIDEALGTLFGKHASPGRLRRIWSTTDNFWKEFIRLDLPKWTFGRSLTSPETQQPRVQRLCIYPDPNRSNIPPALAYETQIGNAQISLFCDGKRLITIDNLQSMMRRLGVSDLESLKERIERSSPLNLEVPRRAYGSARTYTIYIERVDEMRLGRREETHGQQAGGADVLKYQPYTVILQSPSSFMALVPAEDAIGLIESIKGKYDLEFGKVKNRLPLDLGTFFFPRHLPLYAVMDAAKRWFAAPQAKEESWTITVEPENDEISKQVKVTFGNGIEWDVSYATGDKQISDEYHPLFLVSEGENVRERRTYFGGSIIGACKAPYPLLHVTDLNRGDKIQVWPGRFDFEFLETASRRFQVSYDHRTGARRHRLGLFGPRPYYLDDIEHLHKIWNAMNGSTTDCKLSETQKKNIEGLIAFWIEEWGIPVEELSTDETFQGFVECTLKNIGRKSWWRQLTEEERKGLTQAAIDGTFFDMMELLGKLTNPVASGSKD